MRRPVLLLSLVLALAAGAAVALAQERGGPHPVGQYAGVAPGSANLPPRAPGAGGARLLTWPGFQARPDGASRFFLQTTAAVTHRVENQQGRVVIILEGVGLHLRNTRLPLETRFFNTPVSRAKVERRGSDAALVLEMRSNITPVVTVQPAEQGYHYLFVEFPAGNYLPADLAPVAGNQSVTVPAEPIAN